MTLSRVFPSSSASLTFSFCSAESCWDFWAAACFRVSLQGQWVQGYHRNKTSKETVGDNSFTALRKIDLGHVPDKIYNNKRPYYLHEGEVTFQSLKKRLAAHNYDILKYPTNTISTLLPPIPHRKANCCKTGDKWHDQYSLHFSLLCLWNNYTKTHYGDSDLMSCQGTLLQRHRSFHLLFSWWNKNPVVPFTSVHHSQVLLGIWVYF